MLKIPNLRWGVAALLFFASVLNYIDRQALSILAPTIQKDLGLSDHAYGNIVSLFLAAYTIAYLLSGRVVDWLGTRLSMALFIGWWSVSNMLTGLAHSAGALGSFRFLLGLGEAGGYTASPKAVAEWFPPKDRGIAVGIYSMGGSVGATLAPLLVIGLASHYGWRGAFVATGGLGLLFVVLWLFLYRRPSQHGWLTDRERTYLEASNPSDANAAGMTEGSRWQAILTNRTVWVLMAARLLTDPVWYFYQFWLPKYLHTARGFSQQDLTRMWMIFLAADVGFLAAGFGSGWFIRRGREPRTSRLFVMLGCAALMPLSPLVALSPSVAVMFAVAMLMVLGHAAWLGSISTYVVDLVPAAMLGTAFGFIAAGSAVGGIIMNQAVAWAIGSYSYDGCFFVMAVLHPAAFALIWLFGRRPWLPTAGAR